MVTFRPFFKFICPSLKSVTHFLTHLPSFHLFSFPLCLIFSYFFSKHFYNYSSSIYMVFEGLASWLFVFTVVVDYLLNRCRPQIRMPV